jgi:hypothetical protein
MFFTSLTSTELSCPQSICNVVKQVLEVNTKALNDRYLGMPTDVGSSRYGTFKFLKDRIWSKFKFKGWLEKNLSAGGKEVLIKAAAQAIPVYSMECFDHINSLIRQFWWGSKEGKRKPCWVSWQVMNARHWLNDVPHRNRKIRKQTTSLYRGSLSL